MDRTGVFACFCPSTMNFTAPIIKYQDGSYRNVFKTLEKELEKEKEKEQLTLYQLLQRLPDGRQKQGRRHPISLIILILLIGISRGLTTVKDCRAYALTKPVRKLLQKNLSLHPHGIPQESTIGYAISLISTSSLVEITNQFWELIHGYDIKRDETTASFDGKTMRGVHGEGTIRHIVSLFTHRYHQTIGQIGVSQKENEIPAVQRMLKELSITRISGILLIGDALHSQKGTTSVIRSIGCDYLLFIKGNQSELQETIAFNFDDSGMKRKSHNSCEYRRNRHIHYEVSISNDVDLKWLHDQGWKDIAWIGKIHRSGWRKDKGIKKEIDETVYFISSKKHLTAKQASKHIRKHWKIENNLHWQKDTTFQEDRQRLRLGNSPQVMTFLRSICIGLFKQMGYESVTDTIREFKLDPTSHLRFIPRAGII